MPRPRAAHGQCGFTLIELVIAVALLGGVVATFYFMIATTTRGWLLFQGQLDTQQNPRAASGRVVADLLQALDDAPGGTLAVQKATIIVCPVTTATEPASTIYVENVTDLQAGSVVTLTALSAGVSPTTVLTIGAPAACAVNGVTGTALTITPAVTSGTAPFGLPYGTLVGPIAVTYTSSGTQMMRAGQTLADYVGALSITGTATTLSAQAPAGVTTPTVASTAGFAAGDLIFIGSEIRGIVSIAGSTVNLDQGLFVTHAAGQTVRKKIVTVQIAGRSAQTAAAGGQVQLVTDTTEGIPRNPPLR
ncbi:MAG TPA: prepilin-type N-terminal cleavage/methylation domain-containing protein [bacterium]|nr:prepilin-type N-terminal cleavage/methylation domain-containing protein [bacterium]